METWHALEAWLPSIVLDAIRFGNGLLLLFALLIPLERRFARRPQRVRRAGFSTDIAYYFLSSLLPERLLAIPLAGLVALLAWASPGGLIAWPVTLPEWGRYALAFVIAETGFYWAHRWMHGNAWLWRFHAVHHSAEEMDWLINTRAHPLDLVFTRACGLIPLYVLGLARPAGASLDWLPLVIVLAGSVWGYVIHANLRWRGTHLLPWIATPVFHHWHHVRLETDPRTCNYAALLPWLDKLFGTYRPDDGRWPEHYGIEHPVAPDFAGQIIEPFVQARAGAETRAK